MQLSRFFFLHFVLAIMLSVLGFMPSTAQAQSTAQIESRQHTLTISNDKTSTVAQVKTSLISQLEKDGYLTHAHAQEAQNKYVSEQDAQTRIQTASYNSNSENWTRFLSWTNFVKSFGVILLLVAFSGFIKKIIKSLWHLIVAVPAIVYQSVFLAAFIFALLSPQSIWASQSFYVALFSSFGVLIVLGWISATYPQIEAMIGQLFKLGIPVGTVASFWLMAYFGALAVAYHSQIFGFFAAVALSGMFSFTLFYMPGVLFLSFKDNKLSALVWGHIALLAGYVALRYTGVWGSGMSYFNAGIEYYCATALGVGLLVGASPWYRNAQGVRTAPMYALLFIFVFVLSSVAYFLGFSTMATILMCFFALFFLEWVGYVGFKTHWIVGCALIGALVFGLGVSMESYAPQIIENLKTVI